MTRSSIIACALLCATLAQADPRKLAPGEAVAASIVKVIDGDTARVRVPDWAATPFEVISVRVYGIDAPETRRPPGKCAAEVRKGLVAKNAAVAMVAAALAPNVNLTYRGHDKYFRVDADVQLANGIDWATFMLASGRAQPYTGRGPKPNWCK